MATVLFAFLFALLMVAWTNPPTNLVRLKLEHGGTLTVNGDVVDMRNLESTLTWKHRWLSIWHCTPSAYVEFSGAHLQGGKNSMTQILMNKVKGAGFANPICDIYDVDDYFPGASLQRQLDRQAAASDSQ